MDRSHLPGPGRRAVIALGLGLAAVIAAGPACGQSIAAAIGTVEDIRGDVQAELSGKRRPLLVNGEIFVGDTLVTGDNARLVLKLGEATTIKLGAQARLKVEKYLTETGGVFDMQAGHMMFERRGKPATEGITFRGAYGLMAIRGTRFYAGPNRGAFALLVGEGRVEMTAAGRSVMVRPQEGIDIKAPGQASTVPEAWKLPRIREMLANFR